MFMLRIKYWPPRCQGQISVQGISHLQNPNLGPNSGKRILDARILDPNSWVDFCLILFFPAKEGPLKTSPSRNSPLNIHLPKFNPEIGKYSHCASAGPFVWQNDLLKAPLIKCPPDNVDPEEAFHNLKVSHVIFISIIVNPRWRGWAINPKIVQKSRNNILSAYFRGVSAYFRGVSAYFRGVSAYF